MEPALVVTLLLMMLYAVGTTAGLWGVFERAGEPGWAALVPGYNGFVMTRVAGLSWWWSLLFLVPLVNMGYWVVVCDHLALRFNRGIGTSLGLSCLGLVFFPLLGFGPLDGADGEKDEEEPRPRRRRGAEDEEERPRSRQPARRRDADD
jgi:hypothetical protein